jgi:DNA-binding transcriptional LysR family regulator
MQKVNRQKVSQHDDARSRPSLREIEALRAMIASGKTTQAARDLGTSQPSVSRAIASLETRLGQKLFTRRNGRLAPTAQALELEARAAIVFDLLDQLATPRPDLNAATVIRVATPPTLANLFLAPLLSRFIAREPAARARVEIGTSTDCLESVADGRADLGLVDQMPSHDGVRLEIFRRARPYVLLPKRHRLAAREQLSFSWTGDPPGSRLALTRVTASGGFGLEPVGSPVRLLGKRSAFDRAQRCARSVHDKRLASHFSRRSIMTLRMQISLRMQAVSATFFSLPLATRRW